MESKLKALKVVELKEILTKASVAIPAKANKPDLITKIIASRAATDVFEELHGGGGATKGSATPAGGNTPKPAASAVAAQVLSETPALPTPNDDLLAPPEPFDWSAGTASAAETAAKPAAAKPSSQPKTGPKPASSQLAHSTTSSAPPSQPTIVSSDSAPSQQPIAVEGVVEDEETAKRRKRAERFGIPLVEPKKPTVPRQRHQLQAQAQKTPGSATTQDKAATKAPAVNDPEKLKSRAERFGIKTNDTATGQKRAAPAEELDAEELERRRKRAERFSIKA